MDRYSIHSSRAQRRKNSRKVANQSMFYVGAFYITWIPATVNRLLQQTRGNTFFALALLMALLTPAQGFFNFLVYIRPKYLRFRSRKKAFHRQAQGTANAVPIHLDGEGANVTKMSEKIGQVSSETGEEKSELD